jgi:hypothetical protein
MPFEASFRKEKLDAFYGPEMQFCSTGIFAFQTKENLCFLPGVKSEKISFYLTFQNREILRFLGPRSGQSHHTHGVCQRIPLQDEIRHSVYW